MKTFFIMIYFGLYQILCSVRRIRYEWLKKHSSKECHERYLFRCVTAWANATAKAAGVKIDVIGTENVPEETCLFVANHQSYLDIPVLMASINKPIGFVAKKEMEKIPGLSYWMSEMHSVFMDRENVREAVKSINQGIDNLKNGYSMVIFPEGTRSKCDKIGEFKKGSMKLGVKADVPLVPVTIDGTYKAYEGNKNRFKRADVRIIIGQPIYPRDLNKEEQNNLAETFKDIIEANMK